jgi:hypothetical protein
VGATKNKRLRNYNDRHLKKVFPSWLPILYGSACVILIPWTAFLAYELPPRYVSHHWDVAWAGFDIAMAGLFALTALLAIKKSSWAALSAVMLSTILVTDAWFDVLTSRPGRQEHLAMAEAVFIELPLAILSFALAHRIFNHVRHHTIRP